MINSNNSSNNNIVKMIWICTSNSYNLIKPFPELLTKDLQIITNSVKLSLYNMRILKYNQKMNNNKSLNIYKKNPLWTLMQTGGKPGKIAISLKQDKPLICIKFLRSRKKSLNPLLLGLLINLGPWVTASSGLPLSGIIRLKLNTIIPKFVFSIIWPMKPTNFSQILKW